MTIVHASGSWRWLVEEHVSGPSVGDVDITIHLVVIADTHTQAFNLADRMYSKYRGGEFILSASDLTECIPDYLWQAATGATVWYEVRKLERVARWSPAGTAESFSTFEGSTTP